MKALVEVKRFVTVDGVMHYKLVLGGVTYMPTNCAEGPCAEVVVEGPVDAVICEKEVLAFMEATQQQPILGRIIALAPIDLAESIDPANEYFI